MKKVVVVLPLETRHKKRLESSLEADFLYTSFQEVREEDLVDANAIVGNVAPYMLRACQKLSLLQLNSAGTDGYTEEGVLPAGAKLTNATGAYGLAISEHMLGMLLMLQKKLHLYRDQQRASVWSDAGAVSSVYGSTTLVLGMGDIGSEFAKRVHALGSRVIGIRRNPGEKPEYVDIVDTTEHFRDYLPDADVIAMSLPGTPETYHIIDQEVLSHMKRGAILLNVGRGTAVDQDALYKALASGALGACGVDVTDPEPLSADSPLWQCDNMLITPHISGGFHLQETLERIVAIAAENLRAINEGGKLRNEVDFATGYRKRESV